MMKFINECEEQGYNPFTALVRAIAKINNGKFTNTEMGRWLEGWESNNGDITYRNIKSWAKDLGDAYED